MFFIPFGVDVTMNRWPIANWLIMAINMVVYFLQATGKITQAEAYEIANSNWNPIEMVGSCFLHASLWHLLGNMLFLWTFGNAVCAALGTWRFVLIYLVLCVLSTGVSTAMTDVGCIGASGAINGVVGIYLVLFPLNDVSCFWYCFYNWGTVEISGFWLVGLWFCFDIYGVAAGRGNIAYWAHIGGLLSGIGIGFAFDILKWTLLPPEDRCSILALASGEHQRESSRAESSAHPREALRQVLERKEKEKQAQFAQERKLRLEQNERQRREIQKHRTVSEAGPRGVRPASPRPPTPPPPPPRRQPPPDDDSPIPMD